MSTGEMEKLFDELFTLYVDQIFRFCCVKVSNKELAEDLTQETYMRLWNLLKNGNEMTNPHSLLYTIAHNLIKDWYKRKKPLPLEPLLENGFDPPDADPSPEDYATHRELLKGIAELSEEDQTVITLRYLEGLDPKDIGEILNESPNTISVRLNRAKKRLEAHLHYERA